MIYHFILFLIVILVPITLSYFKDVRQIKKLEEELKKDELKIEELKKKFGYDVKIN